MALKSINLAITFLLELCMLAALAYWGFQSGENIVVKLLLGIGTPTIAIFIWARYMAPRATGRLTGAAYLVVKFILFGLATLGLAVAGQVTLALIFIVASVINQILMLVWKQHD